MVLVPDTFLSIQDPAFVNSVGGGHGVNVGRKVKGIGNGGMGGVLTSSSLLVEYVREEFPNAVVEAVGRKYWNDTGGRFLYLNFSFPVQSTDMKRSRS